MVSSLRVRLQLWYALIVLGALTIFAAIVYGRAHRDMQDRVEEQLTGAVTYFDAVLRTFPPALLEEATPADEKEPSESLPPDHLLHGLEFRGSLAAELELHPRDRPFYAVWRKGGSLLVASDHDTEERFAAYEPPRFAEHVTFEHHRGEAFALLTGPLETRIMVGKPVHHEIGRLHGFALHLALVGSGILLVALVGGWFVSSRMVQPISAISATAAKISASNLSERIETKQLATELQPLANVLNESLGRLQQSFAQLTQFTADASHELRTPLAVLQTQLELAAARPRTVEEYQNTLATCLRATERMRSLVDGLLMLARADAGRLELTKKPVNLVAVAEEAVEQIRPLADQAGVAIVRDLSAEPVKVLGDVSLLIRVAANLLANAVQHSHRNASVEISVRTQIDKATGREEAVLTVADHGSGIPVDKQARVFERFFRADPSRNRASGGNGLGLSICRSLIAAHDGSINFQSVPGVQTEFVVHLPVVT
jgi:two-component system OmpR family sensor kinase